MKRILRIRTASRIHVGLIDLGRATARKFGGCGFMIDGPHVLVEVSRSNTSTAVKGEYLDDAAKQRIQAALSSLLARYEEPPVQVEVLENPVQHSGFGVTTAATLAVLAGVRELLNLDASDRDLQLCSGRGGASGVGIHGFFRGG